MPRHHTGDTLRRHSICCRAAILVLSGLFIIAPAPAALAQNVPVTRSSPTTGSPTTLRKRPGGSEFLRLGYAPYSMPRAGKTLALSPPPVRGADADHARHLGRAARTIGSATTHLSRATTSTPAPPICARCSIGKEQSAACSRPTMPVPRATTNTSRRVARCRPRPETMSPSSRRSRVASHCQEAHRSGTDWREAPLFVVPAGGGSVGGSLQRGGQSDATSRAESANHDGPTLTPSEHIFATRSAEVTSPWSRLQRFAFWRTAAGH
jgi:hypothetical protein